MNKVFAIAQEYDGVLTTQGVFATRELAEQALEKYLAIFTYLGTRALIAKGMYIEELTLHA